MVQQILKGTWKEIRGHDAELIGKQVELLVFSDEKMNGTTNGRPGDNGRMYFGMFKGDRDVTEEDFKIAEWRGEDIVAVPMVNGNHLSISST